jgi:peptidyl-prolyl cis-trans isomerase A (cyclophilin A)/peptidyl-prolyl cis-trans isomerase B (cyclophilin B)
LIQVLFLFQACNFKNDPDSNYYCQKLKIDCIKDNKTISFKTSKGDIEVKLFSKNNPVTVSNFIENIDKNIYVNQKFYKIITFTRTKFIHGGVNPENKFYIERNQTLKKTSPSIPLEIKFKEEIKPRYNYQIKNPNEIENLVNTFESGSIAMVKSGKNKSSSTEFFFVTSKIPELDGRYSIFGKVIKGLDVLKKIKKDDYIKEVQVSN